MGVTIIFERAPGATISVNEWILVVSSDSGLRINQSPYLAVNPKSGERIEIPVGPADSEIFVEDQWEPFLRWQTGVLVGDYGIEFEAKDNPRRTKVSEIAKKLRAIVRFDDDDAPLDW